MTAGDLVAALRAGEPWAVDRLYRDHAARVLGWCIRLGGPALDAEDLAQQVFETALRTCHRFRGESALSTWLFGLTRNTIRNARRRAALRRFVGLEGLPEPRDHGPDTEEQVTLYERRRAVQRALERLGTKPREVLVLADLEGRSAPEVSALLGIPPGTVYSRLHNARRAFAAALEAEGLAGRDEPAKSTVIPLRRAP
ncbi:MAG: RNA polymerase sigma factor [Pseudomonadota bacterium]